MAGYSLALLVAAERVGTYGHVWGMGGGMRQRGSMTKGGVQKGACWEERKDESRRKKEKNKGRKYSSITTHLPGTNPPASLCILFLV